MSVGLPIAAANLTRWDAAFPFIVAALLVIFGLIAELLVLGRLTAKLQQEEKRVYKNQPSKLPQTFKPEPIAKISEWTVETAQVLTVLLAPLIGIYALIHHGAGVGLALFYLVALLTSLIVFVVFLRKDPSRYHRQRPGKGLRIWFRNTISPITATAFVVNFAAAVIAYVIGP